jgi:hypothetical protein
MMNLKTILFWIALCTSGLAWADDTNEKPAPAPTVNELALLILDSEALYTTAGGLKPASEGFWQLRFNAASGDDPRIAQVRETLTKLPLGDDLEAGVYVFRNVFNGKRIASAFVLHRPSFRVLMARHADFFRSISIDPDTPAQTVFERVDAAQRSSRWRAYGLIFGYPDYAVEFFVQAGESQERTGQFVKREFLSYPTFQSDEGRFVYAVPLGHRKRSEDINLELRTDRLYTQYQAYRCVYLKEPKLGELPLLEAWCKHNQQCASDLQGGVPTNGVPTTYPSQLLQVLSCTNSDVGSITLSTPRSVLLRMKRYIIAPLDTICIHKR